MTLKVNSNNTTQENPFTQLAKSMTQKALGHQSQVKTVTITLGKSDDHRVPFKASIELCKNDGLTLHSSSQSIHELTAFTQALTRMERKVEGQANRA